jgi:hypothetical protein
LEESANVKSQIRRLRSSPALFELVRKGLNDLVDGEHYFDTVAEDATFEFLSEFPGWPRTIPKPI